MKLLRHLVCTTAGLVIAAAPGLATAEPQFPQAIVSALNLKYSLGTPACQSNATPDCHCTICHATNNGGVNTVTQPFGIAMQANGVLGSVQTAIDALTANKTDSDCDTIPDIEQLGQGRDPNTGAFIDGTNRPTPPAHPCDTAFQAFGCGAQIARSGASGDASRAPWEGAATVVAVLGVALARHRRSKG
jgi:hypothetical protein